MSGPTGRVTRAYVQDDPGGDLELREVELDETCPHDLVVAMEAVGICHSQVYYSTVPREAPMLFGHEGYGRVVATGSAVVKAAVGDRVLVTWIPDHRRDTRPATTGALTLPDGRRAVSPQVYVWAEHTLVDEKYVVRLDDPRTHDPVVAVVACAVPTGVGAVCNTGGVRPGDHVAVIGVGGVGLSAVQGAALAGAERIYAVDLLPEKTELALRLGATDAILATEDVTGRILATSRGELGAGVDVVVDCVSTRATLALATAVTRPGVRGVRRGGSVVLVGIAEEPLEVDGLALTSLEKSVLGSLGGSCTHTELDGFLEQYAAGRLDLDALVTDRYDAEDIPRALADLAAGKVLGRAIATF